ncbi:hypothetical protein RND81_07G057300 [Saponaria officinalis]|uniref:Methyltransferase type 11 domain-containing protein n=1 Tax=Saponaria officinalis TaxID=3572 RepID=A0AAW1JNL2_SAPOF
MHATLKKVVPSTSTSSDILMVGYIPTSSDILMVGCGNAVMSEEMVKDGYSHIVDIDIFYVAIEMMKRKYHHIPQLQYMQMDARDMSFFMDDSFDSVIDKGKIFMGIIPAVFVILVVALVGDVTGEFLLRFVLFSPALGVLLSILLSLVTYGGALLEVFMRKLVFYPEIVGFIEEEKDIFPLVKVQCSFISPPKMIMLDDKGEHAETIREFR